MRASTRGFTLIEILVALIIFAVVAVSVYGRSGETIRQLSHIENRTLAHWVAQNRVAELTLEQQASDAAMANGRNTQQIYMAGRDWRVTSEISNTSSALLKRVEVKVYAGDSSDSLETFVAFIGRY